MNCPVMVRIVQVDTNSPRYESSRVVNISFSAPISEVVRSIVNKFLLLARYVPNVANRSICHYAQYTPPTPTRRNCQVESRRRCVFGFSVSIYIDDRPIDLSFVKFRMAISPQRGDLHVWLQGMVYGVGGSNAAISSWTKTIGI